MTLTGFDEVLPTIAELKEKKKALEDAAKAVQEQIDTLILPIIDKMGKETAGTATVNGVQYDISYKPMERTSINKDNLKRLQIGYPDVYDEYVNYQPQTDIQEQKSLSDHRVAGSCPCGAAFKED